MNLPSKQNEIIDILKKVGWKETRDISSQIRNIPLYELLPQPVNDFISNFGGLKITKDVFEEINIIGIDFFNNSIASEYYEQNTFHPSKDIDIANKNDEYYYSVLIGRQIYFIAKLKEGNSLMIDEDGRFYLHTFIPDFFWISNNAIQAFEKILFGSDDVLILDEENLKWIPPSGKEILYQPPLNNKLTKNPWSH
ncbi:SUKH-3 domain-containing protein [Flavobacterium sp. ALJ2]|uniref:SUKH-3 domain-containing protein n=1 Tax=Flavobacterium sp. ALJ2 TaxID=2786960 RepID=UPI00189EB240|nr:SUKH-3 domain-containing protein [Flavobacterium sp. ALJ2]MBF7089933.1 SUKH-3 domain-containing protein [Flavobacterium sp. ALJ2]